MCYLYTLLIVVSLGTIQSGYMIGSWNTAQGAYGKRAGWDEDEQTNKVMIVQSLTTAGAAVGALFSGQIAFLGKWNCIMIANALLWIGVCLTLISEFWVLCVGRVIYGIAAGAFSTLCPKYIAETAPQEIKGPAGALTQICITLGILVAFSVGLGIGDVDEDEQDSFEIQYYWYIVFAIPLAISIVQVLLMMTVFTYDTPVVLKQRGRLADLKTVMNKIYSDPDLAQERSDEIVVISESDQNDLSYGKVCCSPKYSRATIIGCMLSVFQQLTGINVIMFYSNMVFKGLDMSNTTITALVGIINFLATLVGLGFLACFGRKTIMLVFNAAMALTILLLSYYSFEHNSTGMIVCVLLFIAFFEFSSGPIVWLYMAEIMQDKALSIGAFLNWFLSLVVSITIPLILRQVAIGYIFLFFGICTVFGTLFIIFFMEETRGKSQAEIDRLYSKEVDNDYQKE